jgi:hypothetical protein
VGTGGYPSFSRSPQLFLLVLCAVSFVDAESCRVPSSESGGSAVGLEPCLLNTDAIDSMSSILRNLALLQLPVRSSGAVGRGVEAI